MRNKKIINRNRIGSTLVLFLFFYFQNSYGINFCYEDSSKKYFDLNDPRNPNCPCHKYQKLADEEYKKILVREIKKEALRPDKVSGRSFSNEDKISKKHLISYQKFKRKKRNKFFNLLRLVFGINHWDIWKRNPNPSACYHWK